MHAPGESDLADNGVQVAALPARAGCIVALALHNERPILDARQQQVAEPLHHVRGAKHPCAAFHDHLSPPVFGPRAFSPARIFLPASFSPK